MMLLCEWIAVKVKQSDSVFQSESGEPVSFQQIVGLGHDIHRILVLMEKGGSKNQKQKYNELDFLILVLMEKGGSKEQEARLIRKALVLILVLMEKGGSRN